MKINKTAIPKDSITREYFPANYYDAFKCEFSSKKELTADDLQVDFWTKSPKWVKCFFNIRNTLAKIIGLNTDKSNIDEIEKCIRNGGKYKLFSVVGKTKNETVIKLSDKHLDAYMSIYVKNKQCDLKTVYVITIVHFKNNLGSVYFKVIRPFHSMIVKGMLRYVIKNIF